MLLRFWVGDEYTLTCTHSHYTLAFTLIAHPASAFSFAEFEMQNGVLVAKSKPKKGGLGSLATFATGIVYGLQPDALFVIVPALALPTKLAAAAYIVTFVLGTAGAMAGYTAVIGELLVLWC